MSLHTKYRPAQFKDVVGQDQVAKSLAAVIKRNSCRTFIFTGPSGVGKTTFARLIGRKIKCHHTNLLEIDAATHTGVDAMRSVADVSRFCGIGGNSRRLIIVDEAHMLTKSAWNSLLKIIEEPPEHVWWVFCTTEPEKIPDTIRTRCLVYDLELVDLDHIRILVDKVSKSEGWTIDDSILGLICERAEGSPRRALTMLEQVSACADVRAAAEVLSSIEPKDDLIKGLGQGIISGRLDWAKAMQLLKDNKQSNPESTRIALLNYLTAVVMNCKSSNKRLDYLLRAMAAFSEPYPSHVRSQAPLVLSLGEILT